MSRTSQSASRDHGVERNVTPHQMLDKQYEDDLEKAIALSLETQKLEDLKRGKRVEQLKGRGKDDPDSASSEWRRHSAEIPPTFNIPAPGRQKAYKDDSVAANEPDLMLFSFNHVMKNYDEKKDAEKAPPVPPRGSSQPPGVFGGSLSTAGHLRPSVTHQPSNYQFLATTQAGVARPTYTRQSSFPNTSTPFQVARPSTAIKAESSQWVDPLLTRTLSGPGLPQTKPSPPSAGFEMPKPALSLQTGTTSANFNSVLQSGRTASSQQWQTKMATSYHDDTLIGSSAYRGHRPVTSGISFPIGKKRTSLDSPFVDMASFSGNTRTSLSTSPSTTKGFLSSGLSSLKVSESNSMRRISSNPNFQTGIAPLSSSTSGQAQAVPQLSKQGAESGRVLFSTSPTNTSGVKTQPPTCPTATTSQASSLLDEIWKKKFPPNYSSGTTDRSDLMAFSPPATKQGSSPDTNVFDFREFDPLRPAPPEVVPPKEAESAPVTTETNKEGEDAVFRESEEKSVADGERPKSTEQSTSQVDSQSGGVRAHATPPPRPKMPPRRTQSDQGPGADGKPELIRRPKSVVAARPLSGADIAKPEPWMPGSTYTLSTGRKTEAARVFFGDGLFDLATEKDEEASAFSATVARIRNCYNYDDPVTNPGYIHSPVFVNHCHAYMETSVKVVLLQSGTNKPIVFTCDVNIYVQHVISQALCHEEVSDISSDVFVLKVPGLAEYLHNDVKLSSYEYVQECLKLDQDVKLVLLHRAEMWNNLSRTLEDDESDISKINFLSLFERPVTTAVSKKGLDVLLSAFTVEGDKIKAAVKSGTQPKTGPLIQTVKAICFTLATVEPNEISTAIRELQKSSDPEAVFEKITAAVLQLVDMYCTAFDTDFRKGTDDSEESVQDITVKGHNLRVCVASAHRIPNNVKNAHEFFSISAQLYYGGNALHFPIDTWPARINNSFFDKLAWNQELELPVPVSQLPREARLIFTLSGHDNSSADARNVDKTILGWVAISIFNFQGELQTGSHLLGLWADSSVNPIGTCSSNLLTQTSIILQINFEDTKHRCLFPAIQALEGKVYGFDMLEPHNQHRIKEILDKDALSSLSSDDAKFLWSKRHYLHDNASALPRILEVAPSWDWACLADIYPLLKNWKPVKPVQTLQLLHPRFADKEVRCTAVKWMQCISDDELCDYLPQLVQALKYESYHDSALARFLIERSIQSIRVSHFLYWCLKDSLREQQYKQRIEMILGALLSVCSKGLRQQFRLQEALIENLNSIAEQVKSAKDASRMSLLHGGLETVAAQLDDHVHVPTNPSLEVKGINVQNCAYYSSFTVPLKLVLYNADPLADDVTVMFKAGEDMRQDMLTMQMIRIMDKLWLSEGLDLRMITFSCMATGPNRGLVELVEDSETMRKIQVEHGLTGSFKDKPLAIWLQKHNPTELDYQKAVENFTFSCAGYCVATYVLGIGDRHNDNIMVTRTGHMFHIDFGKFLGNAQMFGSIKRDRTPFVLTPEMAYVINGGEKQSSNFQNFVDLCSAAFNLVRHHADIFFNLFGLMLNAGISQLSKPEDLNHVQNALKPKASDMEATTMITRLIEASLGSKSTQINFFIHNLAHHSFSGASSLELSFAPKRYTMAMDGKITTASMFGIQKRYEDGKYYVYIVSVLREGSTVPSFIFRRYSEFSEFAQKLAVIQPQARIFNLRSGPLVGRTHVKQVAEKRRNELDLFLRHLFVLSPEVSQCDLVYTFFHPSLRDEKDAHLAHKSVKLKNDPITTDTTEPSVAPGEVSGRVQLAIHYRNNALMIMVRHAKDLLALDKSEPDPYIKTYLLPDPHKQTKRKTRVQKKTSNPTYNEMLVYYLPWNEVLKRTVRLTAWDSDYLKENNFLGGIDIPISSLDLSVEKVSWYKLGNLPKET
ncbi:phosphatidylinositol 4-phosphate 3-kinase C2 domain-containing subunit beta-like isoform X2 [Patiria miniata]|uniref:Phosphatidylinositol-4-phosphate 3-kinase n=1 Tax=Patiria miniata TaxID=46514 RepID=A0A913ZRL1_PATMI|nr:phosphatidylinositol 4-phosphate 3-kinase C2 domain-containing subunit beta-like isoform X2 [Patiria miniata]